MAKYILVYQVNDYPENGGGMEAEDFDAGDEMHNRVNELANEYKELFKVVYAVSCHRNMVDDLQRAMEKSRNEDSGLNIPVVMPCILHFVDENGANVDLNAEGVNIRLKKDGTHEYFRSYGFAGRKELTPVYGA